MLNGLIVFLMPTIFFAIMVASSLIKNDILRVGGVFIGFAGMMASVILFIISVILWVGY
jgi:hypothetical protein